MQMMRAIQTAALAMALAVALGSCGRPRGPQAPQVAPRAAERSEPQELRIQHVLVAFRSAAGWVGWTLPPSAQKRDADEAQRLVQAVRARVRQGESLRQAVRAEGLVLTSSDTDHFCLDPSGRCEVEERRASVISFTPSGERPHLSRRPDRSTHLTLERHAPELRPGELRWVPYDPVRSPHGHHLVMLAP